jgi:hypothetical protein
MIYLGTSGHEHCIGTNAVSMKFNINLLAWDQTNKQTNSWPEYSELYRPRNRHLSVKLVPTFVDRGCHVVSVTILYGRILGFLDQSCYIFFQEIPHLYSQRLSGLHSRPTTSQKIW